MSGIAVLPQIQRTQPKVKLMIMKKSSRTCPICIEGFSQDQIIKKLECGHIFHRCCLKNWMKRSTVCPMCRHDLKE